MTTLTTSNSAVDPAALVTGIRGYDPVATQGDCQFNPSEAHWAILVGEQGVSLAGVRSVAEVRDTAGHSSINTTSLYAYVVTDDEEEVGDLFSFAAG